MELDEIKTQIDKGFDGLTAKQDALKKEQDAEIELLKQRLATSDATGRALADKIVSQEKWISSVEAQANTARFGGPGGQASDRLLQGIPQEHRKHVEIAERCGYPDPIKHAAKGLWWHFQYMARMTNFKPMGKSAAEYYKMADDLERAWGFDPVMKGAISETTGGGGSIIATPVEAELWRVIRDATIVRPLAAKILMTSLTHQIPVENANVSASIIAEAATISDSMPSTSFAQQALTAKKYCGLATVSNETLQDNIIGLNEYVFTAIGEAIGILEDQAALDGTNATGIAAASGVNSATVSGTATSGGNIPTFADWVNLIYLGLQATTRKNGAFFCHPMVTKNAISLVDTTGQPILKFADALNPWQGRIVGYPVYEVSSLSTAQTTMTSSTNAYFGPPAKILYGDIAGMTFDLDPYGLFTTAQTRIRVMKRTGILVPRGAYFSILKGVKYT
jgi:HK97 family phage major capsid protein